MNENFEMPTVEALQREFEDTIFDYYYYEYLDSNNKGLWYDARKELWYNTSDCEKEWEKKYRRACGKLEVFENLFGFGFVAKFILSDKGDEIITQAENDAKERIEDFRC